MSPSLSLAPTGPHISTFNRPRHTLTSALKPQPHDRSHHLFDEIPQRNRKAPLYAQSIASHAHAHQWPSVLSTFSSMLADDARPDKFLIPKILKACSELRNLATGAAVHGYMVRIPLQPDLVVSNSLVSMYAKCGDIDSSRNVFDRMKEKDVVTWTALLNAYSDAGLLNEAVEVFHSMRDNGIEPDLICWNALISAFARRGEIDEAISLLEEMRDSGLNPGVNTWNGVISGCVQSGFFEDALDVLFKMCLSEKPNSATVASVLPACAGLTVLELGKELHSYIIRSGIKMNVYVGGSLIDMYNKCGMRDYVERLFLKLETTSLTIWNEMIADHAGEDKMSEALELVEIRINEARWI